MIISDTTTSITALIDELTETLSYLPGKYPQDGQIASTLLALVMADIQGHGTPSRLLMNTLERRGASACEARQVAQALHGLALRLGAWLGRDAKACQDVPGARDGARSIDTTGMAENGAQRVRG